MLADEEKYRSSALQFLRQPFTRSRMEPQKLKSRVLNQVSLHENLQKVLNRSAVYYKNNEIYKSMRFVEGFAFGTFAIF